MMRNIDSTRIPAKKKKKIEYKYENNNNNNNISTKQNISGTLEG